MKNKNMVSWFEIYVEDINRARTFYENLFGIKMLDMSSDPNNSEINMLAFPWIENATNAAGALVKSDLGKPSPNGTIVYFDSEDCNIELARVEKVGGKIILAKTEAKGFGYFCMLSDSEGNTFGIFSSH